MKKIWDRLGIAFSSACVLHCIVVAFIPLLFPAISYFAHNDWIHAFMAISLLITTPFAFYPGFKKHGLSWILLLACSAILFIISGMALEEVSTPIISHSVSIFGSLLLVIAHLKNLQHAHKHSHQCC